MLALEEWSSLTHAGAFLVGAFLATVATLRVMRIVTDFYARHQGRRARRPPLEGDDQG